MAFDSECLHQPHIYSFGKCYCHFLKVSEASSVGLAVFMFLHDSNYNGSSFLKESQHRRGEVSAGPLAAIFVICINALHNICTVQSKLVKELKHPKIYAK